MKDKDKNNRKKIKIQRIILSYPFEGILEIPNVDELNPLELQIAMSSYLSLFGLVLGKCAVNGKDDFINFIRHMTEAVINHQNKFNNMEFEFDGLDNTEDRNIIKEIKKAYKKEQKNTDTDTDDSNKVKFQKFLEQRKVDSFNQDLETLLKNNHIPLSSTKDEDV